MRMHCAEVLSIAVTPKDRPESPKPFDVGTGQPRLPDVKVLFIDERVEGFFLERFNDRSELMGTTQHDTMDEAMWQAYSEYEIADWKACPEDVDPVEYLRAYRDRDSQTRRGDG